MKKLRDIPIEMRSSYTSVFMAAARDVIDTTDAAPNTMPDSVKRERNLCPRISRKASPISSSQSRIAQRLDRREPRRAHRREHAGDQSDTHRRRQRNGRDERAHYRRHLHHVGDEAGERRTEAESQQTADQRHDEDLGEHVGEDPACRGAKGHARAEFAHALDDRGEQDVRDHDAAGHERNDPDDQEDEVEEQQELARLLAGALAGRSDVEVLDAVPRVQQTAHLRLRARAGARLERQEVEVVAGAVLRDRGRDRDVRPLVAVLERVVFPGGEVELLALEDADDSIALLPDAHDLAKGRRGAAEQRIGVLPPQHRDAGLALHVQITEVAPDEGLDVVDDHVRRNRPDDLAGEAGVANAIGELLRPSGAHGRDRIRTVAEILRIPKREALRCELAGARVRRRLAIGYDDRAAAPDLAKELLGQRRLAAEQRQHRDDARRAQDQAEQREQGLAPVSARFVEPGEQRLDEIHTTRPSLIWMTRSARAATPGSCVTSTIVCPAACSSANVASTSLPAFESRFPVGSSAMRIAGSPTRARAIATRWRSPPDSSSGRWPMRSERPNRSSSLCARARRSLRGTPPRYLSGSATFSSTVSRGIRLNVWKTKPTLRLRTCARRLPVRVPTSSPSNR